MGFHDRTIDQIQGVARFRGQRVESPFPDATSRPTVEAIISRRVRPVAFWQIAPWHPGAQHVKYRVHDPSIVSARTPSTFRHQRLQKSPFLIAQIKSHDPPPTTVNHVRHCFSIIYVGTDPSGGSGVGLSWTGIVSQRWEWGTAHLNMETNLTPDQHGELFFDAIIEGPNQWKVRPVFEIYSDSVVNQSQTFSALVGAIWQARDNLAFDVGLRYALVNGRPVNEVRAGVTFGFPVSLGRPISSEASGALPIGRR